MSPSAPGEAADQSADGVERYRRVGGHRGYDEAECSDGEADAGQPDGVDPVQQHSADQPTERDPEPPGGGCPGGSDRVDPAVGDEGDEVVCAVGVALRDIVGQPRAALAIAVPRSRLADQEALSAYAPLLTEAVDLIDTRIREPKEV